MLYQRYRETRAYTESLCEPLEIEDYIPQAVEFASPPKWHLAHVTWFFEEMILRPHVPNYPVFDQDFAFLFNSYYHAMGPRALRAERGVITRPTVAQVYQYRAHVDEHMQRLLQSDASESVSSLVELGIQHEQQHQELLLTDLKYVLALNPTFPVYRSDFSLVSNHNQDNGWLEVAAGLYPIGYRGTGFCFDNELASHQVQLSDVQLSRALLSNGEYLAFIEDGGYRDFRHWLDEGWAWVQREEIEAPLYWQHIDGEWFYYTLGGLLPVDPKAILAHVSFYEANAFANWAGKRLPTEFEWEVAASQLDWGKRWEWSASAYLPYPGFTINEGAVGEYNGKFMVNQMVLRGASSATSPGHSRTTYRNFFHPPMQWQVSGIRLAASV